MTAIRYLDRFDAPQRRSVTTMGTQAGPPGGDGWSVVAGVPAARMPAGHYGVMVTGRIVNLQTYGATPPTGSGARLQVCLGDSFGTRSDVHIHEISVNDSLQGDNGQPFSFLMICGAGVTDPTWGASWSGAADLQVHARGWWMGDATTYGVTFDIVDTTFIWANLDAIPSGDRAAMTGAGTTIRLVGAGAMGAQGETWLHFWNVNYHAGATTSAGVQDIPRFKIGYTLNPATLVHVEKVGSDDVSGLNFGRLGLGSGPYVQGAALPEQRRAIGSFWHEQMPAGPIYHEMRLGTWQTGLTVARADRFAVLSIKLDNLSAVRSFAVQSSVTVEDGYVNRYTGTRFVPVEVPAGDLTSAPWILATGIVLSTWAHSIWIDTSNGPHPCEPIGRDQSLEPYGANATFGSGVHAISAGGDAFRYLVRWINEPGIVLAPPSVVRDIYVLSFFPVRDPDNATPAIPSVGAAVAIVPGTEGLDATSLSDPPIQPDVQQAESASGGTKERIEGATGYVRTWTVFLASRRSWALRWSALTAARRDTLLAFLQSTPTFRITPAATRTLTAVTQVTPIQQSQDSGQTFSVEMSVAELIYRG